MWLLTDYAIKIMLLPLVSTEQNKQPHKIWVIFYKSGDIDNK